MFKTRKGIVTITTFSLIIVASVLILAFAFFFYDLTKERSLEYKASIELITSINVLRSELVSLLPYENSSLIYNSTLDPSIIELQLNRNYIYGRSFEHSKPVVVNTTTLGFQFCSNYVYYPSISGNFTYNGSCISLS